MVSDPTNVEWTLTQGALLPVGVLKFPAALRAIRADTLTTRAGNAALLRLYSGAQPPSADAAATGTLLAQFVCGTPFAAASVGGLLPLTAVTGTTALASGHAGWFRLVSSGGSVVMDGSVSVVGGDGDLQLLTADLTTGQALTVSSFTFTEYGS